MMSTASTYLHLSEMALTLARSDEERIYAIREGTWLGYKDAKRILAKMEDLLNYPRITRMPNMLLVAPSFNGKTSILQRFLSQHQPIWIRLMKSLYARSSWSSLHRNRIFLIFIRAFWMCS
jgi:hypothetical protein